MPFSFSLPKAILAYLTGLLSSVESATCTALARIQKGTSHDALTRLLTKTRCDWQTLLSHLAVYLLGGVFQEGYLILDDTVIDKTFARFIDCLAWVYCSKKKRAIRGLSLVVLAWSNGVITMPLAVRVWKKANGKSKIDLALELLSYARKTLHLKPKYVVFDSWYMAEAILKVLAKYQWDWVSQVKSNRLFEGKALWAYRRNPYWLAHGKLSGGHNVVLVRHGKKYFAASNCEWSKKEILARYKSRWNIEVMFRVLHNKVGLGECQARSANAQCVHIHICLMAYAVLAKESYYTKKTPYQLRREYRLKPERADFLVSKLIFQGA